MLRESNLIQATLKDLLAQVPGQNKRQLLRGLSAQGLRDLTAREVNRALYANVGVFTHDGATPPRWRLADPGAAGVTGSSGGFPLPRSYAGLEPRQWQREALSQWQAQGHRGVVEAVTGTGKTTVGVLAAAAAVDSEMSVLVLVPGQELLDQWHEVLQRDIPGWAVGRLGGGHRDSLVTHRILVSTVQSALNCPPLPVGTSALLVADEVHRYGAEGFARALAPGFVARLGLTATYERMDNGKVQFLEPYFGDMVASCSYERGLTDEILAPFRVAFLGARFTDEEKQAYEELNRIAKSTRQRLIAAHGCPSEPFGEFMKAVTDLNENAYGAAMIDARRYLNAFSKRRRMLADSPGKFEALLRVSPILAACGRGLVFGETTHCAEQSTDLLNALHVPAASITSEVPTEERKLRLSMFKAGQLRVLAAPRVLDEGIDVPQADVGVILGASRSRRQMIQRMGRVIRPKFDRRPATFIVVYIEGSTEDPEQGAHEDFLEEMTEVAREEPTIFPHGTSAAELLAWYREV
ncbi:DEAD/DEAH box helicase [Actinoplanes sp. NPDC024001]|uniref:DEAD/DEAH box helicase n=1 Tax=Actinoplanes sp. NPDC024001 TaxID=3154598 RepID=UPI0033F64787